MQPERDLVEEAGFPHLLYTSQAQGSSMELDDEHSEQPSPYSDAESAASSLGGWSAAQSAASPRLSSIGRADKFRRPPTQGERAGSRSAFPARAPPRPWSAEEDQRLIPLVEERGPKHWSEIAQLLNTDKGGTQCRKR
jgi:hypothetical protein